MKIFTGSPAGPVIVTGRNQTRLAKFALFNQGWHTYAKDRATMRALQGLARKQVIEVDTETGQFRWNDTRK